MKKLTVILLTLCLTLTSAFSLLGCNEKADDQKPAVKEPQYYLALNEYDLILDVGETFALDVKKYDENGVEQTINELTYEVEATAIAAVKDGVITAKEGGKTYVNVTADGIDVSCFVTVRSSSYLNGLVVRLTAKELYVGLPVQAYAYVYEDNVLVGQPTQVSWSVDQQEKASVSASGLITATEVTQTLTINASCVYNGKELTAQKQLSIVEPYYYALDKNMVKLAASTTLSGKENKSHTTFEGISMRKINVLNASDVSEVTDISVKVNNESIATAQVKDGKVSVSGVNSGTAGLTITSNQTGKQVAVKVVVYDAIAQVADMDVLGFASLLDAEKLSGNYALVNDIDYNGGVIIPIAAINDNGSRTPGTQWKYWLKSTETGYVPVSREDFGKEGQRLTDGEFNTFSNSKGINPANLPFTGTFDGNGYSIKNGQIFYGALLTVSGGSAYSTYSSIMGNFRGTLENVSFENITQQSPATLKESGVDITKISETVSLKIDDASGKYVVRGASILGMATDATIKNVYAEINYSMAFKTANWGTDKSVLSVSFGNGVKVSNCVIKSNDEGAEVDYAIDSGLTGSSITSSVKNCFALGAARFYKQMIAASACGSSGCWWLGDGKTWADLLTAKAGVSASNVLSVEQTIATFDTDVWNMSKFNNTDNGRPQLIKGCSIAK